MRGILAFLTGGDVALGLHVVGPALAQLCRSGPSGVLSCGAGDGNPLEHADGNDGRSRDGASFVPEEVGLAFRVLSADQ